VKVGADKFRAEKTAVCEPCIMGKQTRTPFPHGESETSEVLELVHMDVCGPMPVASKGGSRFFATFTDDYSKLSVAVPIAHKSQVVAVTRQTVARLELQSGKKLKSVRTDRGSEYLNQEMRGYFGEKGVVHQAGARYSPEQNGTAERLNRILMERSRAMLVDSGLPEELWAEAVVTANYVRNRTPVSAHGKTPWEMFYGKKPQVGHLRVFGSPVFMHVPKELRHKLQPVSEKGWFCGYEPDAKAYRILRERDGRIIVSRDVVVDERPKKAMGMEFEFGEKELESREAEPVAKPVEERSGSEEPSTGQQGEKEPVGNVTGDGKSGEKDADGDRRRYPGRERRVPTEWFRANVAVEEVVVEPQTYEEALAGPDAEMWKKAMDEEMASLMENGTWELEKLPEGVKALPMKWVYKIKRDAAGNIERYKARLVAKGYLQKQGVDFEEVYAPVSKHTTMRVLLAVVAAKDLELHQLDVKTAFLNGELEEEIYMQQPQGYEEGESGTVCHLRKTLYGLRQAPRAWHTRLKTELVTLGFRAAEADPALFVRRVGEELTYVVVWVDDILVAGALEEVTAVKKLLAETFDVRDLGEATYFLGMELARGREAGTLKLTQKKLTGELLARYGMETAKARSVPINPQEKVVRDGKLLDREKFPYSELVGSLLYLSVCTRPDIAQSVGVLARFMSGPTEEQWKLALGVVRYLSGTASYGIIFGAGETKLTGFCDADYAGDVDSRRSTTGYVFIVNGGAVSWSSRLQPTVAASTVEAEYMGAAAAVKEALWFRKLGADLGMQWSSVRIFCDNQGAIKLLKHPIASQRSKHIDVLHHFARERMARKEVDFDYCPTGEMAADFLTKAVAVGKFKKCCEMIGIE
jgi:hypothetical protein